MNSIVAIVGRPNVGKSTLFNRLVKQKKAITDSESGVTRDRHYGKGEWNGKQFSLIDTGGYVIGGEDVFEKEIDYQVELAIEEADLIIFLVDIQTGITDEDLRVNKLLKKSKKKVFLLVNKVDNSSFQGLETEFLNSVSKIFIQFQQITDLDLEISWMHLQRIYLILITI